MYHHVMWDISDAQKQFRQDAFLDTNSNLCGCQCEFIHGWLSESKVPALEFCMGFTVHTHFHTLHPHPHPIPAQPIPIPTLNPQSLSPSPPIQVHHHPHPIRAKVNRALKVLTSATIYTVLHYQKPQLLLYNVLLMTERLSEITYIISQSN